MEQVEYVSTRNTAISYAIMILQSSNSMLKWDEIERLAISIENYILNGDSSLKNS